MKKKLDTGYKVAGRKMTSRFGYSHSENRKDTKNGQAYEQKYERDGEYKPAPLPKLSARESKACTHPHMVDDSYGGPDSGCMAAHCPRCGYSFHHTLY